MYWGPAPALLLSIVKFLYSGLIGDPVLVFLFCWGALLFQTLLLIRIWIRFFPNLPVWAIPLGIMTVGLMYPTVWMLHLPKIYQAAIFSCQFFLMAGLYFAWMAFEEKTIHAGNLWVAGILWALAIASRATVLGSVLFLMGAVVLLIKKFYRTGNRVGLFFSLSAIVIPVAITLVMLGWYNIARFGSSLEFGLRYQLTVSDLNKNHDQLFSLNYVLPNLYNYTILPFQPQARFPFIKAQTGVVPPFLDGLRLANYQTEEITGILFGAPFLLFVFWPAVSLAKWFTGKRTDVQPSDRSTEDPLAHYRWISICLLGASIISFSVLLIYFYINMRFVADFMFSLAPLAVVGFWQGLSTLKPGVKRTLFSLSGILLSGLSIGIGILLIISFSRPLQNIFFYLFRYVGSFYR